MKKLIAGLFMLAIAWTARAQSPSSCATVGQRANSNGGANSCPNVNGTAYASNFTGTTYATVPSGAKTGNVTFTYSGMNTGLLPYAITQVLLTTTSTVIQNVSFGPAGVPTISGNTTQVTYCFYGNNLPTAGTLSFRLTDPVTGINKGYCSYDASCNSGCAIVANPAGVVLPIILTGFAASEQHGAVVLSWATSMEQNNKGFEIERSAGDGHFSVIGFVPSAHADGNSSGRTAYQYTDQGLPGSATLSYRLRQVDLDGAADYSPVVIVNPPSQKARIWSAGKQLYVYIPAGAGPGNDLTVYDTGGKLVQRKHFAATGTFTIEGLAAGNIYYTVLRDLSGRSCAASTVYLP